MYRHACDVSKQQKWADPVTGQSQHCWGRAMGWFSMACVDVLDFMPVHEPGREHIIAILNKLAKQIKARQDAKTGVWYQVIDRSGDEGNYLEATASTMFVYTLLKAIRKGYINPSYMSVAEKGYRGILKEFIKVDDNGVVTLDKCCAVAGLGGKNYRSGDYQYYLSEPIRPNDPKGVGPFIMASLEWERLPVKPQSPATPLAGDTLVVARDGSGQYRTLAEAIERSTIGKDIAGILGTSREESFIGNTCCPTLEIVALSAVVERTAPSEDAKIQSFDRLKLNCSNIILLLVLIGGIDALTVIDTCLVMEKIVLGLAHLEGITIDLYTEVAATAICSTLVEVTAHTGKVLGKLGIVA